jgi:hypothetical protein
MTKRRGDYGRSGGPSDVYTGNQYQEDFLGGIDLGPAYKEARAIVEDRSGPPHKEFGYYVNYPNSVDLVERFQPIDKTTGDRIDPTDSLKLLQDIKYEVVDLLEDIDNDEILAFTSVGSTLDHFHGIDAFIKIKDPNGGKPFLISFDITLKRDKDQQKADILIPNEIPDPAYGTKEEKEYGIRVSEIAKEVVQKYRKELEERRKIKERPRVQVWTAPGFEDGIKKVG